MYLQIIKNLCLFLSKGWVYSFASKDVEAQFKKSQKKICISAHSTPFADGAILHVALNSLGQSNHKFYTIGMDWVGLNWCEDVTPFRISDAQRWPPFSFITAHEVGVFSEAKHEKRCKKGGFVQKEIKILKETDVFCRCLFPSGGTVKWKTGFFVLAKETGADIFLLGLDYSNNTVTVDSVLDTKMPVQEATIIAQQRLRKYSAGPLYYILRVLIGYGCETYDISTRRLLVIRLGLISVTCYLFYTISHFKRRL